MDLTQYLPLIQTWYAVLGMCALIGGLTIVIIMDEYPSVERLFFFGFGAIGGALISIAGGALIWIVKAIFPRAPIGLNIIGPIMAAISALVTFIFMSMFVIKALKEGKEAARRRANEEERVRESEAWQAAYTLLPPKWCNRESLLKRLELAKNTDLLNRLGYLGPSGSLALQHVKTVIQNTEEQALSISRFAVELENAVFACDKFLSSPVRDNQHGIRRELPHARDQLKHVAPRVRAECDAIGVFVVDTIADIINGHAEIATNFAVNWEKVITRSVSKCEAVLPVAIPALQQARGYLRW